MKRMMFIEMDFPDGLPEGVVDSNIERLQETFESIIDLMGFSNSTILYTPQSDASADLQNVLNVACNAVYENEAVRRDRVELFADDMRTVFEWPKQ